MAARLTPDMLITDVLRSSRGAAEVFARHGLACPSCLAAGMESLDAVAHMHGVDVTVLIRELQELPNEQSEEVQ